MLRNQRFTFRINEKERHLIEFLAEKLHRSSSDALRFLVLKAAREMENQEADFQEEHPLESE